MSPYRKSTELVVRATVLTFEEQVAADVQRLRPPLPDAPEGTDDDDEWLLQPRRRLLEDTERYIDARIKTRGQWFWAWVRACGWTLFLPPAHWELHEIEERWLEQREYLARQASREGVRMLLGGDE